MSKIVEELKGMATPHVKELSHKFLDRVEKGLSQLRGGAPHDPPYEPPACPEGMQIGPPDFVGIGAQRSGTSWWYNMICNHERVFSPSFEKKYPQHYEKERHFFDYKYNIEDKNELKSSYHRWFPRPEKQVTGEWTPVYMLFPWVSRLLKKTLENPKILVLLRDPIERFRSGMEHSLAFNDPSPNIVFRQYRRGMYFEQLSKYVNLFDKENILLLQYEKCVRNPTKFMEDTLNFVGLDIPNMEEYKFGNRINTHKNDSYILQPDLRSMLKESYEPQVKKLSKNFEGINVKLWKNF